VTGPAVATPTGATAALRRHTARQPGPGITRGEFRAVEAVDAPTTRIEPVPPRLNAVVVKRSVEARPGAGRQGLRSGLRAGGQ
jgi:hypothetical protein